MVMRLVWAIIPLVLIGIIGMQESFAEQASGKSAWKTNSDKVCGDRLCADIQESFEEIFGITYNVIGGEIQEIQITETEFNDKLLVIKTEMTEDGEIFLEIPKSIWNLTSPDCQEHPSGVLIDGKPPWNKEESFIASGRYVDTTFTEDIDETKRSLIIETPSGTKEIKLTVTSNQIYDLYDEGKRCFLIEQTKDLSPKDQINAGVLPEDVTCKSNFFLAVNSQNNSSACVKPNTLIELFDRNWANNSDELGKVWVELSPITCRGYGCNIEWLDSYDLEQSWNDNCVLGKCLETASVAIKDHYGKLGFNILDIKYEAHPHFMIGEFGDSPINQSFFFLIPSSDLISSLEQELVIIPQNNLNRDGVYPETWAFADPEKVPYWIVNRHYFYSDENCSGYLQKHSGALIPSGNWQLTYKMATIDFDDCPFYEQSKFQIHKINNILDAIDSGVLTHEERLEYIKIVNENRTNPLLNSMDWYFLDTDDLNNEERRGHTQLLNNRNPDVRTTNTIKHVLDSDTITNEERLEYIKLLYGPNLDVEINTILEHVLGSDNFNHEERLNYIKLFHEPHLEIKINHILDYLINSDNLNDEERLEYIELLNELQNFSNLELFVKIKNEFVQGETISFTLIESGYSNPCTSPKISIYQVKGHPQVYALSQDIPLYEYQHPYSCDEFEGVEFSSILNYYTDDDFPNLPRCIDLGEHWIVGPINSTHVKILANYSCVKN